MTENKYPLLIRILHWLMALCIIGLIASGWYMEGLADDAANKYDLYPIHKSFGVLILIFLPIRLLLRLFSALPALPEKLASWEKLLAKVGHFLLYLGMIMVPISGFIMSDAGGHGIKLFGISLPELITDNKSLAGTAHGIHEILPYVLLAIVILHIAGAIKHRFLDKDPGLDVLNRML